MAKQLNSITKMVGEYAGTAANGAIVATTAGIEQLTTLAVYNCPCVEPSILSCNISDIGPSCAQYLNFGYGLSFIIAPAIALYGFGIMSSPRMWKTLTGCIKKTKMTRRDIDDRLQTILEILARACISPMTWVAVALLDGRYYACSTTALPYDVGPSPAIYLSCEVVATTRTVYNSDSFRDNRSLSQLIGWIVISAMVLVGLLAYGVTQCTSPLTYYHAKYYRFYRNAEEAEFDDEMKKKAQKDAEANVLYFMKERRDKRLWDQVSTVYEFRRDKKNLALYSYLHQWVLKDKEKKKSEESTRLLEMESEVDDITLPAGVTGEKNVTV